MTGSLYGLRVKAMQFRIKTLGQRTPTIRTPKKAISPTWQRKPTSYIQHP